MSSNLGRTGRGALVLFLAFLLEPTRCVLQPVAGQAAEIRPAIIITEGQTPQGFPYVFGGVSSNEREAMEERAKDYNLKLVFAEKNGPYLSGVTLSLSKCETRSHFHSNHARAVVLYSTSGRHLRHYG